MDDDWRLDDWQLDPPGPDDHLYDESRTCDECGHRIRKGKRSDIRYCSNRCRQSAYRRNNGIATLTLNLDYGTAAALTVVAEAQGVSSQTLAQCVIRDFLEQFAAAEG